MRCRRPWSADAPRLADGGTGAQAYADAVATYLGLSVSKASSTVSSNAITSWMNLAAQRYVQQHSRRQAIPMVWDFC